MVLSLLMMYNWIAGRNLHPSQNLVNLKMLLILHLIQVPCHIKCQEAETFSAKELKPDTQRAEENRKEGKGNAPLSAKDLKLGTKVNAKVYQICEPGLVLDLDGIRGMYHFKENDKKDFKIGDEMRVVCSSFSSKGIPVMSDVDDN